MKKRILGLSFLLLAFTVLFVSCSKDEDNTDVITAFDGTYSGYAYVNSNLSTTNIVDLTKSESSTQVATWIITITNGEISSDESYISIDDSQYSISGSVDANGNITATSAIDGEALTISATISDEEFSGTWEYEDGSSGGTMTGSIETDDDGDVSDYDGTYGGNVYDSEGSIIDQWSFSISDGSLDGVYSSSEGDMSITGSVDADGNVTATITDDDIDTVTLEGTISGSDISGTWSDAGGDTGTWSGSITDNDDGGVSDYDGSYSGNVYNSSGSIIDQWSFTISNGSLEGVYSSSEGDMDISGSVDADGNVSATITDEDIDAVTLKGTIYGSAISGTWSDAGGDTGTWSGSTGSGTDSSDGDVSDYDGTYSGNIYDSSGSKIDQWSFTVSNGAFESVSSTSEGDMSITGSIDTDGNLTATITDEDISTITLKGIISGSDMSGTWTDEDGDSGTVDATKE